MGVAAFYVYLSHDDFKIPRVANLLQKMVDIGSSFATTEEVQHSQPQRVLLWSALSLLFLCSTLEL